VRAQHDASEAVTSRPNYQDRHAGETARCDLNATKGAERLLPSDFLRRRSEGRMCVQLSRKKDHEIRKVLGRPTHIETTSQLGVWFFTLASNEPVLLSCDGRFCIAH
jgi:hypothetical protein